MSDHRPLFVTSFGPSGFDLYGRTFIDTFVRWVEGELYVYVEGEENIPPISHPNVEYRDLLKVSGMMDTLKLTNFHAARGLLWGEPEIDYRFNVHRFCRKSFAQIDAAHLAKQSGRKAFYWLDADIEFTGQFVAPEMGEEFMIYMGRSGGHSCSSFVGWNLTLPVWKEFFDKYWALYITGTVSVLPEWHDAFVMEWLRKDMNVPSRNLATNLETSPLCNVFDMVFPQAHHKKGQLK